MDSTEPNMLTDLKLEQVGDTAMIVPVELTDTRPLGLSKIDQSLVFPVETIRFFAPNPHRPVTDLVPTLRDAFGKVLVPYHFLAGRLRRTEFETLEVDCNRHGAPFAHYTSGLRIADLGDLGQQNPLFRELVPHDFGTASILSAPLVAIQVTIFACGGFSLGSMNNHALMDGVGISGFFVNWTAIARGEGILFRPEFDRSPFMTRDPPIVKYDHPELLDISTVLGPSPYTTASDAAKDVAEWGAKEVPTYVTRMFTFTPEMIKALKERALESGLVSTVTTFDVLAAQIWVARTKAVKLPEEKPFNMLFAVDIRKVMKPALSKYFSGNAVSNACARATPEQVKKFSFPAAVQAIQQAAARVTDDYVRSSLDCRVTRKAVPGISGGYVLVPWYNLPKDFDYGWGTCIHNGPCATSRTDFLLLLANYKNVGAIDLKIALKSEEMDRFRSLVKVHQEPVSVDLEGSPWAHPWKVYDRDLELLASKL